MWSVIPFLILLISIAVLPLAAAAHWESNQNKLLLSLFVSLPVLFLVIPQEGHLLTDALADYFSFMCLMGALFVISGGVFIRGAFAGTPIVNTTFLGVLAAAILSGYYRLPRGVQEGLMISMAVMSWFATRHDHVGFLSLRPAKGDAYANRSITRRPFRRHDIFTKRMSRREICKSTDHLFIPILEVTVPLLRCVHCNVFAYHDTVKQLAKNRSYKSDHDEPIVIAPVPYWRRMWGQLRRSLGFAN